MTSNWPGMFPSPKSKVQSPKSQAPSRRRRNFGHWTLDVGLIFKHLRQLGYLRSDPAGRQALQKELSIHLRANARIEDCQYAAIRGAANQTSESLLQSDDRLRHAVLVEARPALFIDMMLPRGDDGIAGNGKWQLVDDYARKLFAAHIHALPET